MQTFSIVHASVSEAEAICSGLRIFNRKAVADFEFKPLRLVVHDGDGTPCGGLVGEVYLGWFAIEVLWVAEALRGRGMGAALLARAEADAIDLGAHSAFLDTFAWQAESFYARHGYVVFGRLDDFPAGAARIFMRKALLG